MILCPLCERLPHVARGEWGEMECGCDALRFSGGGPEYRNGIWRFYPVPGNWTDLLEVNVEAGYLKLSNRYLLWKGEREHIVAQALADAIVGKVMAS